MHTNPSTTIAQPYIPSVGVVMATSVSPPHSGVQHSTVGHVPSIDHPSARLPLLPHSQPLLPSERNQQYDTSTFYNHKTPLLAMPPSHNYPLLPLHEYPQSVTISSAQYPHPVVHSQHSYPTGISPQGSRTHPHTGVLFDVVVSTVCIFLIQVLQGPPCQILLFWLQH